MTKQQFIYLSYFLDSETPLYGGKKGISIVSENQISLGDSANTKNLSFQNHSGTHVDFPNHFFEDGNVSDNYDATFWVFNNPFVLNIEVYPGMIINPLKDQIEKIPPDTDFLILKTGFGEFRGEEIYWSNNPGLHPEFADSLRIQCKFLRAIGMDFISITSFKNRKLGRIAHKAFLGKSPILLVEDMNLINLSSNPVNIFCFPLLVKGVDGCPVTVIAEYN
jgi:arylformamidase